jgi:hypothetical protein
MPNWCYNSLTIEGSKELVADVKRMLNRPFVMNHESWNSETRNMEKQEQTYSNPIFAFHNIYNYRQDNISDEVYYNQEIKSRDLNRDTDQIMADIINELATGNSWYDWNTRNWGTKWDVAVADNDEYPDTEITDESVGFISYRFNTAWAPPTQAISKLSEQYPDLDFELSYEEETGWGGLLQFEAGNVNEIESYDNKCRDCDSNNTMEYCDNDCGEICNECHYMAEADLDAVAECDTHKVYLDDNHVPDYRKENA